MSTISHNHDDKLTVDSDVHFTIDTVTRMISNQNGEEANKKLILTQYDNNSERYSFDIDRVIENHDLLNCNRVQVHYVNAGPGKNDKPNIGSYLIPIEDIREHETNPNKLTFSWLISRNATLLNGTLSFAISFECIDGDKILYRWSTATFEGIRVAVGMDNDNAIMEHYVDELLVWQNNMETELLPNLVDECYVDREFATSEEVRKIFNIYDPATDELIGTDTIPTDGSNNLITSGGVKYYTDNAINDVKDIFNDYYTKDETYSRDEINEIIAGGEVDLSDYYKKSETYSQTEVNDLIDNVQVDLSDYYKKSETYSQAEIDEKVENVQVDLSDYYTKSETYSQTEVNNLVSSLESDLDNKADKSEIPDISGKVDKVDGKDLSTNDYTTAEKNKLAGLSNYDDSAIQQSITELQNGKADKTDIPDVSNFITKDVDNLTNYYKKTETYNQSEVDNKLSGKQDTISDLETIRSNATAGKSASDTMANYGDIVTHNASEFVTSGELDGYVTTNTEQVITGSKIFDIGLDMFIAFDDISIDNPSPELSFLILPGIRTKIGENNYYQALPSKSGIIALIDDIPDISGLQTQITSANKLASDLVDDTDQTNKFITTSEKEKLAGLENYDDSTIQQSITELQNGKADKTEMPDISGKADKTELSNYVSNTDLESKGYLTSLPSNIAYNDKSNRFTKSQYIDGSLIFNRNNPVCIEAYVGQTGGDTITPVGSVFNVNNTDGVVEIGGNEMPIKASGLTDGTTTKSMTDILSLENYDDTTLRGLIESKADQTSLDTTNSNVSALQKRVGDNEVDITTLFTNVNSVKTQYLKDATVLSDFSTGGNRVTITKQDDTTVSFDTTDGCLPSSTKYLKTATISEDGKQLILTKQDNSQVVFEGGGLEEDGSLSQIRIKELWKNNSPTLAFTSQTIDLNSNDYDFLLFIYCFYSYNSDYEMSVVCQKGNNAIMTGDINASSSPYVRTLSRSAIYNNDTSYTFDGCYHSSSSGTSINNEYLVPKCIYGIKKQPAMIYTGTELFEGNGISIENGVISGNYGRLLWTNNYPTNGFSAQKVNLDLSNYDLILITFFTRAYSDRGIYDSRIISKNTAFYLLSFDLDGNRKYRRATATDTGVNFDNERATDDCVPYQIYGLKIGV